MSDEFRNLTKVNKLQRRKQTDEQRATTRNKKRVTRNGKRLIINDKTEYEKQAIRDETRETRNKKPSPPPRRDSCKYAI